MFFLIPKNVTSERPIALMLTLIRWWQALRTPEVAKWQRRYRVDWDAADERNGGAHRTVWEVPDLVTAFGRVAGGEDLSGSSSRRPGEGLRASQSPCGVGLGNALQLPKEDIGGALVSTSGT